jgi:hypothetical protein
MTTTQARRAERQVLLLILLGFVLAYAGALLAVALHKKAERADMIKRPLVHWMPSATTARAADPHYLIADLMDPSLLSLPNTHGFSHELWQRQTPAIHQTPVPDVLLAYLTPAEPDGLPSLLEQTPLTEAVRVTVDKDSAVAEDFTVNSSLEPAPVATQSVVRVDGNLTGRFVIHGSALPTIASETPLRPTEVRVGVGVDGTVRYAMLQRSCGNESVDGRAVELARTLCFEPENRPGIHALSWGLLRFFWAVRPPAPATNAPPAAAP